MSLFEKIKSRKINLTEQSFTDKQRSDMKKLLNKNFGSKEISKKTADTQKNLSKANKEVFNVTGKSAVRDAKKYASGEYPKIGGGTRIGSKSKGSGAETGAKVNLNTTSGSKSKGTTPVKVNITKPIKQSEVSKKAKVFTQKIDKKKISKEADRLVRKAEKGDKAARKQIFKTVTKRFKKLSPADQKIELTKMSDIQKKMGRTFNPKTGNFEGPDTEFQKSISKIKDSKGKRITSGPVSVTAGPDIRKRVEKIRDTRATKAGMPDPFKSTTKAQTKFDDIFKGVKKTKKFKLGGQTQFDISKTPVGKIKLPPKKLSPEVQKKTFDKFSKEISDATKQTKKVSKKIGSIKPPKTPSQPETGFGGTPGSQPVGGTSGSSTKTVKQSEVSKQAKEFTKNINSKKIKNTKVKGDPLLGNFDYDEPVKKSKPKNIPPKPSSTPPTDPPGKLVQGRDFSSKKAYDAKISKQVKILRDKADRLRTKQIKLAKTNPAKGTPEYETRSTGVKKIGARMKQRKITADALERSLKRQGVKGPTGMLPVVSGAGANEKVKAFGNKTFKQFYKDAGVSKREPIKPIKPIEQIKDTTRNINKKYSPNTGNLGNTAFNQNVRGVYKKIPKALRGKNLYRIGKAVAKNPYVATAVGLGLGGYAAYKGIKALTNKPKVRTLKTSDLKSKKTGSTVTYGTGEFKGKPVRFDALGLGFTKKKGVEKKKPTYQDFQSGKYTFK